MSVRVERVVDPYVVFSEAPLREALGRISANRRGVVCCVSQHGLLEAVLTDGDVRRWLVSGADLDLEQPAIVAANRAFTARSVLLAPAQLAAAFDQRVRMLPLVDDRGRLVAVAFADDGALGIDGREVGPGHPVFVIAEIGINHQGRVDLAEALVDAAADAGADCAKFQLRDMDALYRQGTGRDGEDLGPQYTVDLLSRFALGADELEPVFERCRQRGLIPLCTPWDRPSVARLAELGMPAYKVASADLTNHDLLEAMAATGRPLLVSTGMSTEAEIIETVGVLRRAAASFALLHCVSTYPAPFRDVNLAYLDRLAAIGGCPVGYSGHERGWHVAVAAVARGACIIEKHITLDRTLEGNDHKVSLEPAAFASMVREIHEVHEALGQGGARAVGQGEMMNRVSLAKSLVATRDLPVGHVVGDDDVTSRSPGRGLQPNRRAALVGRTLRRAVERSGYFYESDLDDDAVAPRAYRFRRPWGLPVRYHDLDDLAARSNPDFVEFHLSYHDLERDPAEVIGVPRRGGYTVHAPDLYRGDHLLDLAADDPTYRARSVDELRAVVDLAERLRHWFPDEPSPIVVSSLGGFTRDAPLPLDERKRRYERVAASLDAIELPAGIRLACQTLPPYPWYLGGQFFGNLFVDADDTAWFAATFERTLCLDVSHTALAANHADVALADAVEALAPHTIHLHLVDAVGVDGEGVQVGEGDVDWPDLAERLDRLCPDAGFIPEIWQGHVDGGAGFWTALERLEAWF